MRRRRPGDAAVRRSAAEYELGRIKRAMVRDILRVMKRENVSQAVLARRLGVSRSVVARLLEAEDSNLTLRLLGRVAAALGARVSVQLSGRLVRPRKPGPRE